MDDACMDEDTFIILLNCWAYKPEFSSVISDRNLNLIGLRGNKKKKCIDIYLKSYQEVIKIPLNLIALVSSV